MCATYFFMLSLNNFVANVRKFSPAPLYSFSVMPFLMGLRELVFDGWTLRNEALPFSKYIKSRSFSDRMTFSLLYASAITLASLFTQGQKRIMKAGRSLCWNLP